MKQNPTAPREEIKCGITRYSLTIVASFCALILAAESAFGQISENEAAYGSRQQKVTYLGGARTMEATAESVPAGYDADKGRTYMLLTARPVIRPSK
jgi:hypothetical protein